MQYIIIFVTLVCAIYGAAELVRTSYRGLVGRLSERRGKNEGKHGKPDEYKRSR